MGEEKEDVKAGSENNSRKGECQIRREKERGEKKSVGVVGKEKNFKGRGEK
uniref:Uncharacterized protein n=1 Tax=Solanum tuberosum TaxID=4113 RepID=M1CT59_SOLTU